MSWIPLHDTIFTDDWLCDLTEAERWAYICFVLHARQQTPRWRVKKCSPKNIARVTSVTPVTFETMLLSAIKAGKIVETETDWKLVNGRKYDYDETNADRQERYRNKNKETSSNSNGEVTTVTVSNANNGIEHNITEQDITEQGPDYIQAISDVVESWNRMAADLGYSTIRKKLTEERKRKLRARLKEPEFKIQDIIKAFYEFKPKTPPSRDFPNGWKPDFDFVIRSETTYTQILEGKFSTNGNSNGNPKVSDDFINKPETRIRPDQAKF